MQNLKLALQNVERAPELTPDVRAQLTDKLQIALARGAARGRRSRTNSMRPARKSWPRPANGDCSTIAWPATAKKKSSSSIASMR